MKRSLKSRFEEFMQYLFDHPEGGRPAVLASRLSIHRSTLYRYPARARLQGYVIDDEPGLFRLRNEDRRQFGDGPLILGNLELSVLMAQLENARDHSPIVRTLLDQLKRIQGRSGQVRLERPSALYVAQREGLPDGLYDALVLAIEERCTLELTYRNKNGVERTYCFDPYVLIPLGEHLYAVGSNIGRRERNLEHVHRLRLDSILSWATALEPTPPHVPRHFLKPDFDPAGYLTQGFLGFDSPDPPVLVSLEVAAHMAHTVGRTRRHSSQQTQWLEDGRLIYTLEVPITPTLVAWILSYGSAILSIQPDSLKRQVLKEVREMVSLHGKTYENILYEVG